MNAYLSVENNMLRFRTDDDSINILFSGNLKVEEIYRINSFSNGMINADVKYRMEGIFREENSSVCPDIVKANYDMQSILDLIGVSSDSLKEVTEVKVENSDNKKNKYYFMGFQKNGCTYIEVTDKDKKYRSVHNASNLNLIATTMPQNMVYEYSKPLKEYYNSLSRCSSFGCMDDDSLDY